MLGGLIMILGVIIQVTCEKGHKATAQFIIGRTITGIGNGIVSFLLHSASVFTNSHRTLPRFQHIRLSVVVLPTVDS